MQQQQVAKFTLGAMALLVAIQVASAVITVQIGGATRLSSLNRQRERYSCYWDCDLVGCQIARDDDECAYDCEKICRLRYDYAGRSSNIELKPKSGEQLLSGKSADSPVGANEGEQSNEIPAELLGGKFGL